ncbi:hypothetical protein NE865_08523 [Phthorimaea operculella]|nr:hypothetical protein NE865_08523 [Phthorimaea operculella]
MNKICEIEPIDTFDNVFEGLLSNLYVSNLPCTDLEPHIIQAAKEDIKNMIENSKMDVDTISKELQDKGWSEDKVNRAVALIERKKNELLYAAILNHNSKYGQTVQNFDWALKLIKGTNDLKTLNYPLLQLVFSLQTAGGELTQSLYDINKESLKKFIDVLENKDNL